MSAASAASLHAFTENLVDADGTVFREKEISLLMRTRHRRVVLFHGAGRLEKTGEIFLVSEFMPGGDLRTWLSDGREFSFRDRVDVARDIAEGMSFLHEKKLIHRDLKSLNVLMTVGRGKSSGAPRAKIADFGLSRFTRRGHRKRRMRTSKEDSSSFVSEGTKLSGSWLSRRRRKSMKKKKREEKLMGKKGKTKKERVGTEQEDSDGHEEEKQEREDPGVDSSMSSSLLLPAESRQQSNLRPSTRRKSISSFAHDLEMTGHTGSLLWMAPEILNQWLTSERGAAMDRAKYSMAADVYSMGIVLYELVTRRLPWGKVRGPLTTNIGERVTQGKRPKFTESDRQAVEENSDAKLLSSMMRKCWAGDARTRPQFSQILWHLGGPREDNRSFSSTASGAV